MSNDYDASLQRLATVNSGLNQTAAALAAAVIRNRNTLDPAEAVEIFRETIKHLKARTPQE